jgi:DHA1 family bicyclomycin/chloramphenicol resistance-like MFS transporter
LAGAWILVFAGWRTTFAILTAFGIVVGVMVIALLRESRSADVERIARAEHPIRGYITLLGQRQLLGYILAGALNAAGVFTYIATSSRVFIGVYGTSPKTFAFLFGMNSVGLIGASQLNRILLRYWPLDGILKAGAMAVVVAGAAVLVSAVVGQTSVVWLVAPLFLTISSASVIQTNCLARVLTVGKSRPGSSVALFGSAAFALGAMASTVAGLLDNGTAQPMAAVIVACTIGCVVSLRYLALPPTVGRATP